MYVGEKPVCWWNLKLFQEHTFHQHTEKVSPTYFTNIHLNFCSKCSPTYRKFFTNILHQHTFNFLFKFFTNIQFFSPTYRKFFANILHQHTYKFLSSPTYRKFFTNILFFTNIFHQHHYSRFSGNYFQVNFMSIYPWKNIFSQKRVMTQRLFWKLSISGKSFRKFSWVNTRIYKISNFI